MYNKTNWKDNVTPLSSSNFNNMENGVYKLDLLYSDNIQGTSQNPTFTGSDITQVQHKQGSTVIRTDTFAYTRAGSITTKIIETRTLNTGEVTTLTYNFDSTGNYTGTVVS